MTEQLRLHTGTYPDNPPRGLFGFLILVVVVVMVMRSFGLFGGLAQQFLDENLKLDTRVLNIQGMVSMLNAAEDGGLCDCWVRFTCVIVVFLIFLIFLIVVTTIIAF
jgi:hypothetical protein